MDAEIVSAEPFEHYDENIKAKISSIDNIIGSTSIFISRKTCKNRLFDNQIADKSTRFN